MPARPGQVVTCRCDPAFLLERRAGPSPWRPGLHPEAVAVRLASLRALGGSTQADHFRLQQVTLALRAVQAGRCLCLQDPELELAATSV